MCNAVYGVHFVAHFSETQKVHVGTAKAKNCCEVRKGAPWLQTPVNKTMMLANLQIKSFAAWFQHMTWILRVWELGSVPCRIHPGLEIRSVWHFQMKPWHGSLLWSHGVIMSPFSILIYPYQPLSTSTSTVMYSDVQWCTLYIVQCINIRCVVSERATQFDSHFVIFVTHSSDQFGARLLRSSPGLLRSTSCAGCSATESQGFAHLR